MIFQRTRDILVLPPLVYKQFTLFASSSTAFSSDTLAHGYGVLFRRSLLKNCSVRSSKRYSQSFSISLSSTGIFLFGILIATISYHSFYSYTPKSNKQIFVMQYLFFIIIQFYFFYVNYFFIYFIDFTIILMVSEYP